MGRLRKKEIRGRDERGHPRTNPKEDWQSNVLEEVVEFMFRNNMSPL